MDLKLEHYSNYRHDYTVIHNSIFEDKRLSWKDTGIFSYLWHLPANWSFRETEIATHKTDGINGLKSGIKHLKRYGYIKMVRKSNGRMMWLLSDKHAFAGHRYKSVKSTQVHKPHKAKPYKVKSHEEQPQVSNPAHLQSTNYNKIRNKQNINKDKIRKHHDAIRSYEEMPKQYRGLYNYIISNYSYIPNKFRKYVLICINSWKKNFSKSQIQQAMSKAEDSRNKYPNVVDFSKAIGLNLLILKRSQHKTFKNDAMSSSKLTGSGKGYFGINF